MEKENQINFCIKVIMQMFVNLLTYLENLLSFLLGAIHLGIQAEFRP